jgi:hypothetical protein
MVLSDMGYRLSLMAAWVLQRRGNIESLTIEADGKKFSFAEDILNTRYQEALDALCNAKTVEVIAEYGVEMTACESGPTPFGLLEELDAMVQENPEYPDGMFYSFYHHADYNDAGALYAYGRKNGVLYAGEVPFAETDHVPEGNWYAPQTAIACDVEAKEGRDIAAIGDMCNRLSRFSEEAFTKEDENALSRLDEQYGVTSHQVDISANHVAFCSNFLRIKNDAEMKEMLGLYAQLIELTDGECSLIGELVDISGPDRKVLHFDVESDGSYKLQISAVAE